MEGERRMGLVIRLIVSQEILFGLAVFGNKFRTFFEEVVG